MLEGIWASVHGAVRWEAFQAAAVVVGGARLHRTRRPAFALAIPAAALGGLALGTAPALASWVLRRGPPPAIEIAGSGALLALVVVYALASRRRGDDVEAALDALAPALAAMIVVARVGCFFAGCDFGSPTRVPWAIRYPQETPAFRAQVDAGLLAESATSTLPVHPTQLYEALAGAVILVIASRATRARFAIVIGLYACARIAIDLVRGDLGRGILGTTPSQLFAIGAIAWLASTRAARMR